MRYNIHQIRYYRILYTVSFIILLVASVNSALAQTIPDNLNKTDANGKKQGKWRKLDMKGCLVYEGTFIADKPEGLFSYYDTLGFVSATSVFSENGSRAVTTAFYPSGVKKWEGAYVNEVREGLWQFFNEAGIVISEENYLNGKPEGTWKKYYANGALLEELNYRNGVKDGTWKQYYYDGPVKQSATYRNGLLEGLASFFHPNGRVMVSGPYIHNMKDGVWLYQNDSGVAEKREIWSNGFLSAEEYYDKALERMVKEEK